MTEKRFTIHKNELDFYFDVIDAEKRWEIGDVELDNLPVFEDLVDLLNELNDKCEFLEIENEGLDDATTRYVELYHNLLKENKQLNFDKQQLHRAMSREDVRHKQFSDKVFDLIDEKIKELPTTITYGDINEDLRIFAQQILYDLKKELKE